jgi:hypothetical protein
MPATPFAIFPISPVTCAECQHTTSEASINDLALVEGILDLLRERHGV